MSWISDLLDCLDLLDLLNRICYDTVVIFLGPSSMHVAEVDFRYSRASLESARPYRALVRI